MDCTNRLTELSGIFTSLDGIEYGSAKAICVEAGKATRFLDPVLKNLIKRVPTRREQFAPVANLNVYIFPDCHHQHLHTC